MIIFSDLLSDFGILESEEGKLSGLSLFVTSNFEICDLIGKGLEMFFDLFFGEVLWNVLDDDSTHEGVVNNTFFIINFRQSTTVYYNLIVYIF